MAQNILMTDITSGTWSAAGNFQGKDVAGERIFIAKDLMATLGYKAGDIAKGFSCAYRTNLIGQLDEKGNPKIDSTTGEPVKVARVEATAVFETADAMHEAFASRDSHSFKVRAKVEASAKSAGLTEAAINNLLSVAF
ncbi:MAG: hypothetical protein EBR30_25540 [Cytophagia bacterium]|jgi:hypothetical protein|nr:hypothetical protein [Cytophagia bacterium]